MGAYMSAPITEKHGEEGENDYFQYGVSSMQGWRIDMEDAHLACLDAKTSDSFKFSGIYGVFDGHGGREVAQFCSKHLLQVWRSSKGLKEGKIPESLAETFLGMDDLMRTEASHLELEELAKKPEKESAFDSSSGDAGDQMGVSQAQVKQLIMGIRQNLNKNNGLGETEGPELGEDAVETMVEAVTGAASGQAGPHGGQFQSDLSTRERALAGPSAGCTAVVAVIVKDEMVVANAGDSRCVFSRNGRAVAMSRDHKPLDLDEADRAECLAESLGSRPCAAQSFFSRKRSRAVSLGPLNALKHTI